MRELLIAFVVGFFLDFADWVVDNKRKAYYSTAHVLAFLSGVGGGLLLPYAPHAVLGIIVGNAVIRKIDHSIYLGALGGFAVAALLSGIGEIHWVLLALYAILAALDELPFFRGLRPFLKAGSLATFCLSPLDALTVWLFDAGYHLNGWVVERSIGSKGSRGGGGR